MESLESRVVLDASPASVIDLSGLAADTSAYDSSHVLVSLKSGASAASLPYIGMGIDSALPLLSNTYRVSLSSGWTVQSALTALSTNPFVAAAQPDYVLRLQAAPNDPSYGSQWDMNKMGAPTAWNASTGTGRITVGVIDSGIDYAHPDLVPNMWLNQGEIPATWLAGPSLGATVSKAQLVDADGDGKFSFRDLNTAANAGLFNDVNGNGRIDAGDLLTSRAQGGWADGVDTDANGYKDDFVGWNFAANTNNPMDDLSHGTHVAGTIGAAGNNGIGVAGVAWNVRLMALRFIDSSGTGSTSNAISALNYAVKMGAQISNNSWGGGSYNSALFSAIQNAQARGHIFVAAAGNNASNNDATPFYPANYNLNNIVAVGATDRYDDFATYSNYGAATVDLAAPGTAIYSTMPGGGYGYKSGTSMAAPHVAGALALLWDANPTWSYSQVIQRIYETVDKLTALDGKVATGGRLNIGAAMGAVSPPPVSPPPVSPPPVSPPPVSPPPPATVTPDRFEANDTFANATNLGKGNSFSQTGLSLHSSADADFFKFIVSKAGTFNVTVTPAQSGAVSVELLNAQGAVLSSGAASLGAAGVTLSLQSGVTYYVRVTSATGSVIGYDLSIANGGGGGGGGGKGGNGKLSVGADAPASYWLPGPAEAQPAANGFSWLANYDDHAPTPVTRVSDAPKVSGPLTAASAKLIGTDRPGGTGLVPVSARADWSDPFEPYANW